MVGRFHGFRSIEPLDDFLKMILSAYVLLIMMLLLSLIALETRHALGFLGSNFQLSSCQKNEAQAILLVSSFQIRQSAPVEILKCSQYEFNGLMLLFSLKKSRFY